MGWLTTRTRCCKVTLNNYNLQSCTVTSQWGGNITLFSSVRNHANPQSRFWNPHVSWWNPEFCCLEPQFLWVKRWNPDLFAAAISPQGSPQHTRFDHLRNTGRVLGRHLDATSVTPSPESRTFLEISWINCFWTEPKSKFTGNINRSFPPFRNSEH